MNFEKTVCQTNPSYLLISLPSYFTTTPKNLWTQNEISFLSCPSIYQNAISIDIFVSPEKQGHDSGRGVILSFPIGNS